MKTHYIFLSLTFLFIFPQTYCQTDKSIDLRVNLYRLLSVEQTNIPKNDADNGESIFIKCKVNALTKLPIDVNAFSLVDKRNKKRYRLIDFSAYKNILIFVGSSENDRLLKKDLTEGNKISLKPFAKYNSAFSDSFYDYSLEGFEDIEYNTYFKSKHNTSKSVVYYKPVTFKKFMAYMYFMVEPTIKPIRYYLYYKDEKVGELYIKQ